MIADSRQLRGQSDARFSHSGAIDLIASWLDSGLLTNGIPVLWDMVRAREIVPPSNRKDYKVQARSANERERIALDTLNKANAASGLTGAALAKKNDDAPTLAKWQSAALLQRNYYVSLVAGWS